MDTRAQEIRAEDVNPRWNWGRALPALGTMAVDFEERVDYRRLHKYRIGHLGDVNELMMLGALAGTEMALALAGVPHKKGGVQAAMDYLVSAAAPARAAAE